jgi:putative hemolysin
MSKDRFPSPFSVLQGSSAKPLFARGHNPAMALAGLSKKMIEGAKARFAKPARVQVRQPAAAPVTEAGFTASFATSEFEIREAQRLRYKVFAEEMGASLTRTFDDEGRPIDADMFDAYCDHLIVRDNATQQVIGTYRILAPHQAKKIGCYYSESEFFITRLLPLRHQLVELGRSCVHQDYRTGPVIMLLWKGIAQYMKDGGYDYLMGCASVSMRDGGHTAASLFRKLEPDYMANAEYHVFPRLSLPLERLDTSLDVEAPPLVKGYLRIGARIAGAPAWDPDFNTADLPMLMSMAKMNPRYRKHFFGD